MVPETSAACPPACACAACVQSDTVDAEGNQRIWGTHHRRRDMETMIWRFLTTFRAQDTAADEGMATYTHLLRQVCRQAARSCTAAHCSQSVSAQQHVVAARAWINTSA
jgi:hypothetical protein